MAALSDYAEQALLNHLLRNTALTSPTTVYLALFTTNPTDDASGSEVADSGYDRQSVAFDAPATSDGGYAVANSATVEFSAIADGSITITHFGIYDASTSGSLLVHGAFTTSRTLETADIPTVAPGAITVTFK
jgi:hypothetical protein